VELRLLPFSSAFYDLLKVPETLPDGF
jgi:hypothetical protein